MTDYDRRELAELYRVDDRLRAEHEEWIAQRASAAPSLARKSEPQGDLVYRTTENALQPATALPGEPSYSDASADDDDLATALDEFSKATVDKFRALDIANAELRGKVDALLVLLGQKSLRAADVIDLPDWRKRDVA